jgi:hypothetical protein
VQGMLPNTLAVNSTRHTLSKMWPDCGAAMPGVTCGTLINCGHKAMHIMHAYALSCYHHQHVAILIATTHRARYTPTIFRTVIDKDDLLFSATDGPTTTHELPIHAQELAAACCTPCVDFRCQTGMKSNWQ